MNYQEILDRFQYEDDGNILDRVSKVDKLDYQMHTDIIHEIVLWKINRMIQLEHKTIDLLQSLEGFDTPLQLLDAPNVKELLCQLLLSKGIQLPIASTILHFYYPDLFPIIDQRSYREVTGREYPIYQSKDKVEKCITLYMQYITDCYLYNQKNCPSISFRYIDKILYQIDKEKGYKVRY